MFRISYNAGCNGNQQLKVMNDPLHGIVRIIWQAGAQTGEFRGTGIAIAPGYVLTCRHVIEQIDLLDNRRLLDAAGLYIADRTGQRYRVREVSADDHKDLALLTLEQPVLLPCLGFLSGIGQELETALQKRDLWVVGYPGHSRDEALWRLKVTPKLQSFSTRSNQLADLQLEGGVPPGCSGSPVLIRHRQRYFCVSLVYMGGVESATSRTIGADAVLAFLAHQGKITADSLELADPLKVECVDARTILSEPDDVDDATAESGRWRRLRFNLWLPGLLSILFGILLALTPAGQKLNDFALDSFFALRGPLTPPAEIILVKIDDDSLSEFRQNWPWSRRLHAELIDTLFQAGVKVIAFDIVFAEPSADRAGDREFAAMLARHPGVILAGHRQKNLFINDPVDTPDSAAEESTGTTAIVSRRLIPPLPEFIHAHTGVGITDLIQHNGIVRSLPAPDSTPLPLSDAAVEAFVQYFPDQYPHARRSASAGIRMINFTGPAGTIKSVSYYQALRAPDFLAAGFFRNKMVFVGATTNIVGGDRYPIPFTRVGADTMAGVEIHANAAYNRLYDNFIAQPSLAFVAASALLLNLIAGLLFLRLAPLAGHLFLCTLLALAGGVTFWLFVQQHWFFPPAALLIPVLLVYIVTLLQRYRQLQRANRRIRTILDNRT